MEKEIVSGSPGQHPITRVDAPGKGGAAHAYVILGLTLVNANPSYGLLPIHFQPQRRGIGILFQQGNPEEGSNGIHSEDLLAILIDRHEGFDSGPFACEENKKVLSHLKEALALLDARRERREEAGVLGQQVADPDPVTAEIDPDDVRKVGDEFTNRIVDSPEIPTGSVGVIDDIRADGSFSVAFDSLAKKGEFNTEGELTTVTPYELIDPGNGQGVVSETPSETTPKSSTESSTTSSGGNETSSGGSAGTDPDSPSTKDPGSNSDTKESSEAANPNTQSPSLPLKDGGDTPEDLQN